MDGEDGVDIGMMEHLDFDVRNPNEVKTVDNSMEKNYYKKIEVEDFQNDQIFRQRPKKSD